MDLLDNISTDIASGESDRINYALGAIYWIADLNKFGGDAATIPDDEPYIENIRTTELNAEFISGVKVLLRDLINSDFIQFHASAVGLLGEFSDCNDKEMISECLEKALSQLLLSNGLLHQSISALEALSEIDTSPGGLSLPDINRNVELSLEYMKKSGKEFNC